MSHFHVSHGLAGYGPDVDENTPTFTTLGAALEYARDELSTDVDMAHEDAHALALHASQYHATWKLDRSREDMQRMALDHYADAWRELERVEAIELLRANLDPARSSAPLYVNDAAACAALQEEQAAGFPVDVSPNSRLYLWSCDESECEEDEDQPHPDESDGYVNEPAYGSCVVSLDGRNIGQSADVEDAFRILANRMREGNYFPNVWHVNERGNTTLVSLDVDTGAYTFTEVSYV